MALALRGIGSARNAAGAVEPDKATAAAPRPGAFGGLPTLAAASPEYARLVERRDELQAEQIALRTEIGDIGRALDEAAPATDRAARAARVIDGNQTGLSVADLRERLRVCHQRAADLDAALEVLTGRISEERMRASAIIRDRIDPQHKALVRTICDRLVALHEASAAYTAFANELNAGGVAWSALRAMPVTSFLGDPRSKEGAVARYLREAVEYGFISPSAIPAKLRR
jgi:hypothetical protein